MPRRYVNPPVVEALGEISFDANSTWDLAIPGLIYERVQKSFPKRQPLRHFNVSATINPAGFEHQVQQSDRVQFLSKDTKSVMQVGPHLLSVHRLQPYDSWEQFLPKIMTGIKTYVDVASPRKINRLTLRYINEVVIPASSIELSNYFDFYPHLGDTLPQDYEAVFAAVQMPIDELSGILVIQLSDSPSPSGDQVTFILDLYCLTVQEMEPVSKSVEKWLKIAHDHIEKAFEGVIKQPLRDIFGEVK